MKRRDTYDKDSGCISTLVCVWVAGGSYWCRTWEVAYCRPQKGGSGHRRVTGAEHGRWVVQNIRLWVVQNIGGWVVPDIGGWVVKDIEEWLVKDIGGWLVKDIDSGW